MTATETFPHNIFSIGHSNRSQDEFLDMLKQWHVDVVADVRSNPVSKFCPHFNSKPLKLALQQGGFSYVYLGKELGGIPQNNDFYDADTGQVDYGKIAASHQFQQGIARLLTGLEKGYTIAIMCGEENPAGCHRRNLIGKVLRERQIELRHIRNGGIFQTEADIVRQEEGPIEQLSLFGTPSKEWKSKKSLLTDPPE